MTAGRPLGTARPPSPTISSTDRVDLLDGCFNGCGEVRQNMLRTYSLVYGGKVCGYWRLCAECFVWGNPHDPQDGDPLRAPEAA